MTHLSDTSQVCICSSDDFKIHMKPNADCLTQHSSPAQPMQDEASSGAAHRPGESPAWQPERSEGASAPDASQPVSYIDAQDALIYREGILDFAKHDALLLGRGYEYLGVPCNCGGNEDDGHLPCCGWAKRAKAVQA